ncbi:Cytokinin oxidase 5 [Hibiscus syriacus]|uniref:Cytokinin oxidase 5 n=1 Tax=Hibiscus syriacus TaxID=106335 RepID=A0A6A2XNB1_HIBSY|nr:Cytokinin oxidase 5 [Hibiscus syriacus]
MIQSLFDGWLKRQLRKSSVAVHAARKLKGWARVSHASVMDDPTAGNVAAPRSKNETIIRSGLLGFGWASGQILADVILSEDTRHSGMLLHYYSIKTALLSYHKYNESQREETVLKRLKQGEIIALVSDAGMPGISDPGTELAKICVDENIPVIPIPGPSAFLTALSASGLSTDEFTFVGFLPKHASSRKERLMTSASEKPTQIFYVPPHKLSLFLEESSLNFGDSR